MGTNVIQTVNIPKQGSEKIAHYSLDTLEVTSETPFRNSPETLANTTLKKWYTNAKLIKFIDVETDPIWIKKWWKGWHCRETLLQDGNEFKYTRCRQRWCSVCCGYQTADLVKGYKGALQRLAIFNNSGLYFVTLTAPTVPARQLRSEISKRLKFFVTVKNRLIKQGIKINGFRKLEVTYTAAKLYHPHFHIIVQGEKEAHALRNTWMALHKDKRLKIDIKGNHVDKMGTEVKDLLETFKYSTKDVVHDETEAKAQTLIYKALKGFRVYQPLGKLKKAVQPKQTSANSEIVDGIKAMIEIWGYQHALKNYVSANGELLVSSYVMKEVEEMKEAERRKRKKKTDKSDTIKKQYENR
jgi:hypothetical protein